MPYKHGYYKEPWFNTYRGMMDRCYRKKAGNYYLYGEKGISVCGEWHDIEKFKKWVEVSDFKKGLTIDRIDVRGNYCPQNCKWSTAKEQCNNRGNTIYLEHNGEKHTISEWADIKKINRSTLNSRICRGWDVKKALAKGNYYGTPN